MSEPAPQILRYAQDFSELYARYGRLRRALLHAAGEVMEVARALTEEELVQRLERSLRSVLPGIEPAVYQLRREKLWRMGAARPGQPAQLSLSEAERLETEGGEQALRWIEGRRGRMGLVIYASQALLPDQGDLLTLLCRHAGLALENLSLEEQRRSRRAKRTTGVVRSTRVLGESPAIQKVMSDAAKLGRLDSTVLLEGETGTGKSLLAQHLHDSSPRAHKPFVVVNCAAIPAQLVESELFGHEAGAFTGAVRQRRGYVEQAEGGTLFLDEVGELPADVQAKLLTFLEDRTYRRVGAESALRADVRILSATNADLDEAVQGGRFRLDLLYRLRVFSLRLPPLRERGQDVLVLAEGMLRDVASRYELDPPQQLSPQARERLLAYGWPGNARELRNALERALILSDEGELAADLLPDPGLGAGLLPSSADAAEELPLPAGVGPLFGPTAAAAADLPFKQAKDAMVETWERAYLSELVRRYAGNVSAVARAAELDKRHVHRKLKLYEIDPDQFRGGELVPPAPGPPA